MTTRGGFCTDCGHRVESFDGLNGCPKCGTRSIPCADEDQVTLSINWHELHILVLWAENWQRAHPDHCGRVVYAIAKRIAAQHPTRGALTLAEELGELARSYELSVTDPALRQDIAEQTGEEAGLLTLSSPDAAADGDAGE